jgi:hypothetical protein
VSQLGREGQVRQTPLERKYPGLQAVQVLVSEQAVLRVHERPSDERTKPKSHYVQRKLLS